MTPAEFREIREGLGLPQAKLAVVLRCHARTVQKYELGERKIPALTAEKLEGLRDETRNA